MEQNPALEHVWPDPKQAAAQARFEAERERAFLVEQIYRGTMYARNPQEFAEMRDRILATYHQSRAELAAMLPPQAKE